MPSSMHMHTLVMLHCHHTCGALTHRGVCDGLLCCCCDGVCAAEGHARLHVFKVAKHITCGTPGQQRERQQQSAGQPP